MKAAIAYLRVLLLQEQTLGAKYRKNILQGCCCIVEKVEVKHFTKPGHRKFNGCSTFQNLQCDRLMKLRYERSSLHLPLVVVKKGTADPLDPKPDFPGSLASA